MGSNEKSVLYLIRVIPKYMNTANAGIFSGRLTEIAMIVTIIESPI